MSTSFAGHRIRAALILCAFWTAEIIIRAVIYRQFFKQDHRMKLVHNWSAVLRRAYSVRLMIVAAILSGLEVVLPLIGHILPIPTGVFAALSFIVVAAAFVARLCAQKGLSDE